MQKCVDAGVDKGHVTQADSALLSDRGLVPRNGRAYGPVFGRVHIQICADYPNLARAQP